MEEYKNDTHLFIQTRWLEAIGGQSDPLWLLVTLTEMYNRADLFTLHDLPPALSPKKLIKAVNRLIELGFLEIAAPHGGSTPRLYRFGKEY